MPVQLRLCQHRQWKCVGCSGIKRHFFYQPVRVNRELYEESCPNPDTVRNVRKFFEEHILPTPGQGLLTKEQLNLIMSPSKLQQTNKS
ncbi:Protein javelin [Lucilia cuprina]|nr:Protein javelin [Lucilia cuprina]